MSIAAATPARSRRPLRRGDSRRRILDATEALLVEAGYAGFSMRRLSARCGYTAPTIYHHFGDKQSLLDAVLDERFGRVLARVRRVQRRGDPADTLRARLLEIARFGVQHPIHSRLLALPRPDGSAPPPPAEAIGALFEEPLAELAAAGRLRAHDVEQAAQFLWICLEGSVSLLVGRPDVAWQRGVLEFALDTALRGLVAPSGLRASPADARGRVRP
jgi:AcrR family transcriptional regulator